MWTAQQYNQPITTPKLSLIDKNERTGAITPSSVSSSQASYLPPFLLGSRASMPQTQPRPTTDTDTFPKIDGPDSYRENTLLKKPSFTTEFDKNIYSHKDSNIQSKTKSPMTSPRVPKSTMSTTYRHDSLKKSQTLLETVKGPDTKSKTLSVSLPPTTSLYDYQQQSTPLTGTALPLYETKKEVIQDDEESHWTTIFGFPPEELDRVIHYFQQLGTITNMVTTTKANHDSAIGNLSAGPTWIHIRWQDPLDAIQISSHQCTILTNRHQSSMTSISQYMIGVVPLSKSKQRLQDVNAMDVIWSTSDARHHKRSAIESDETTGIFLSKDRIEKRSMHMTQESYRHTEKSTIMDRLLEFILGSTLP